MFEVMSELELHHNDKVYFRISIPSLRISERSHTHAVIWRPLNVMINVVPDTNSSPE